MAVLQSTATGAVAQRHNVGDLVIRAYTLTGTNGDTFVTTQQDIISVLAIPTTAISVGATVSGSTVTVVTSGAFTATFVVLSRVG